MLLCLGARIYTWIKDTHHYKHALKNVHIEQVYSHNTNRLLIVSLCIHTVERRRSTQLTRNMSMDGKLPFKQGPGGGNSHEAAAPDLTAAHEQDVSKLSSCWRGVKQALWGAPVRALLCDLSLFSHVYLCRYVYYRLEVLVCACVCVCACVRVFVCATLFNTSRCAQTYDSDQFACACACVCFCLFFTKREVC
jgi:hypothetical protein